MNNNNNNNNSSIVNINRYKNIKSPQVLEELDIYTYLQNISNPDIAIQEMIEKARCFYKEENKEQYDKIKSLLPCYTLNFGFDQYKQNSNIIGSTGLIYIDLDNETNITMSNKLIFASWMSLSNNGRGILVKIEGLNLRNFQYNYNIIAKELGIVADKGASKATQYTIQSYDSELYINDDSITYVASEPTEKVPTTVLLKKRGKDSDEMGIILPIRFNTVSDYDFNSNTYIFFPDDKESIAEVYVSKRIEDGSRNNKLYSIGLQFRGINPTLPTCDLKRFLRAINRDHFKPPLKEKEFIIIFNNIMSVKDLQPNLNKERRILFNPKIKLTHKEKMTIMNPLTGKIKRGKTYQQLKEFVKNWNYEDYGKITIKKLTEVSKRSKNTVAEYYKQLRKDPELF
jgi:hypothetical protein